MSISDWQFLSVIAFFAGMLLGAFAIIKAIDWDAGKARKKIDFLEEVVNAYKDRALRAESAQHDAWIAVEEAGRKKEEYRQKWADELQKRLDLADKLEKYTGGKPVESGAEDASGMKQFYDEKLLQTFKEEKHDGEVSSGD